MPTMKFTTAKDKNKKNNYNTKYNNDSIITIKATSDDKPIKSNSNNSSSTTITNENTLEKFMRCPLCDFSCLFSNQMIQHTLRIHTVQTSNNSQTVENKTSSKSHIIALKRKIEMKHINGGKKAKLDSVSSASPNPSTPSKNTQTSATSNTASPDVYACKECEYNNPIKKNYERHMWCHTSDFPFKCRHCSFSSNAENAVQRHITQYHTAIKKNLMKAFKEQQDFKNLQNTLSNVKNEKVANKVDETASNGLDTATLASAINNSIKQEAVSSGELLRCIIIKTRTKDNVTSWACHSCNITSASAASMHEHTTSVHHTPLNECVTIIQDYYIITGAEQKEASGDGAVKDIACVHCGFEAADMDAMRRHLKEDCHGFEGGKGDDSGEEGEQKSLSMVLEKSKTDAKGKGSLGKFSRALNEMMEQFTSFYSTSSKKLYLVCFICKYKTFSMKVLKKHLVKEHADLITSRKQLSSLSRKCLFYSLKHECKLINKSLLSKVEQEPPIVVSDEGSEEEEGGVEGDGLLKMEAAAVPTEQSADGNKAVKGKAFKSAEAYKMEILESLEHEGELNRVFECSVCGKKVFFKCNLKKHVESTHPKAKILQLSLVDGTLSHDELSKFHKKHRVNKLKKLLSKKGLSKNELIALNGLIADELGGQTMDFVLDRSEVTDEEKVGMIDNLRLKRFQCGVCSFRSNFRSDISRHLKVKHPNTTNSYYTVLNVQEASESLESYNQARPTIDMRYTKQRNNSLTLIPSKNTSTEDDTSNNNKDDTRSTNETTSNIKSEPTPAFSQAPFLPASNNYQARAFYMNLPYSVRRLNPLEDFLKCDICPFYTFKATSFKVHRSCHQTINRSNMLSCPHCPFFVSTKRLYEKHLQQHSQYNLSQAIRASSHAHNGNSALEGSANDHAFYGHYGSNNDYLHYCHQNYKSAHLRFCQHKYICPQCPFKTNRREDFWCHGKFHFQGEDRSGEFKCEQCCFYASDKRGLMQHSTLHNKGYTPKAKLNQSDLVKGEFCRCDLADFLKYPDLACFRQLSCIYCSYCNNSVRLLRQHIASHVPLSSCYTTRIFSADLDGADDLLNVLCTRLLNMNYSLAEEAHKDAHKAAEDNTEMPVLEKFTELPPPELYNPHHNISVSPHQPLLKPPIKVINLYNNSFKHLSDGKPPKVIKITSHLSTTTAPPTSTSLPPFPMPPLKTATASTEVKNEVKEEVCEDESRADCSEAIEASMQSLCLSAPEELVPGVGDGEGGGEGVPIEDEEAGGSGVSKDESVNWSEEEKVWRSECESGKRIFMLSLGLVEFVHI